jgi:hypothetical protein
MIWMDVDIALASVPLNAVHLIDDTDFKTREDALTYDQAGLDLKWVFTTTAGVTTSTAVTPTTAGDYDWTNLGNGYYALEIPASGGASINNDTEGFGHFEGYATGVLPWRGPTIGFRAASANDMMVDGTALVKTLFADGFVWVDDGGTNSTDWAAGYGSACLPTTTIANGKVIADALGLRTLHIHGAHTLAAAMENYSFVGSGHIDTTNVLDVNGQSIEHSTFTNQVITGAGGNAAAINDQTKYWDCYLYAHTNIQGEVYRGRVEGACSIRDTGYASFVDCLFGSSLACTLTLQAPTVCDIEQMTGTLTLSGMDGGVCSISMSRGAVLVIDNTCTAGTITITGATEGVTDNSNGSTVSIAVNAADMIQVSGDAGAADNLEAVLDGTGGVALVAQSLTLTGGALRLDINGTTAAAKFSGGTTGIGLQIVGGSSSGIGMQIVSTSGTGLDIDVAAGDGINIDTDAGNGIDIAATAYGMRVASTGSTGIYISSGGAGHGIQALGTSSGSGMYLGSSGTGAGLYAKGGTASGPGIYAIANDNNDAGMELVAAGTGADLDAGDLAQVTTARMGALTDWIDGGRLDLLLDAITAAGPTKAQMDTAHALLATVAKQDVIDGIVDAILALLDDPRGEPGQGAPPVNPDLATKIDYLFKNWRNKKTQTSTEFKIYADDATTADHKAAVSDDGTTATKGEMGTGA